MKIKLINEAFTPFILMDNIDETSDVEGSSLK